MLRLKLNGAVYESFVSLAILYRCDAWFLRGKLDRNFEMEISMVRAICGVQRKDRNRGIELRQMLGLNEMLD